MKNHCERCNGEHWQCAGLPQSCECHIEKNEHEERIFDILNCFEVDARNITNGHTFIDSQEARKLARAILRSIEENS